MKLIRKALILFVMLTAGLSLAAQHRPTGEFMQSLGFRSTTANEWKNASGATVTMDGDNVVAFRAPQTHAWTLVFGDGAALGHTIKIKTGDVVTFKDGVIKFPSGTRLILNSNDSPAKTSRGLLKSALFNKTRNTLSVTDIKIINGEKYSPGWLNLSGKENDDMAIDEYGNIVPRVLAQEKAEKARRAKINSDYEQAKVDYESYRQGTAVAEYEEYCKKYGKSIIDKTLNGDIVVGAPWDLLEKVIHRLSLYNYKKKMDTGSYIRYDVYYILKEPNKWNPYFRVYVDKSTGLVSSWYEREYFYRP